MYPGVEVRNFVSIFSYHVNTEARTQILWLVSGLLHPIRHLPNASHPLILRLGFCLQNRYKKAIKDKPRGFGFGLFVYSGEICNNVYAYKYVKTEGYIA